MLQTIVREIERQARAIPSFYEELTTHFQPILSAKDGKIFGYEALTRHISKPLNVKKLFLEAKKSGLILLLDMICRRNAIKNASEQGMKEYLFINISPEVLSHPDHKIGLTDRLAEEFNFPKERIVLEITEEEAITGQCESFYKSIFYYKERGYKVAIDDFGVGWGGPKLLSLIEPDFVKIDQYFVQTLGENSFSKAFTEFLIAVCNDLNIMVVAEGIENEEHLREALNLGVDLLQGFYLGRPERTLKKGPQYEFPYL